MKKLIKLVRLSSKESFIKLRNLGEIKCVCLGKKFKVTNLFLRHISGNASKRSIKEIIYRLTSINLIEKIAKDGILTEIRKKTNYGKIGIY